MTRHKSLSDETAHLIDEEVRTIIDRNYVRAASLLNEHMRQLHKMAEALIRFETIDQGQIADIMDGREPREPEDSDSPGSSDPETGGSEPEDSGNTESSPPGTIGGPASLH